MSVSETSGAERSDTGDGGRTSPVASFVNGPMQASVFRDTVISNEEHRVTYSVSFAKRYRERGSNTWRTSHSLFPADLPNAIRCLQRALQFIEKEFDGQS